MTEIKFLECVMDDVSKTAKDFRKVACYLRKRRSCPSAEQFERGITKLDDILMKGFERIKKLKEVGDGVSN